VNASQEAGLPLAGIKVIDFTQVMMGPCATQMLGDYGADVIKIERPGAGDLSRTSFPNDPAGLLGPVFCSLNRNKRSVALDLRKPETRALVRDMIATADVVVNNFRAGVMERMGFGYEDLAQLNPRLIYAVGTGYGLTGPYAHKGGQDVLAQAMSGVMARRADPSHPLSIYATTFADYSAGMHLVQGILLALLHRERTGEGQKVSVALYNSMLAAQMQEAAMIMNADTEINWAAMPLTGVFETKDGAVVVVGAFKANPLRDICAALGIDDISGDPRYATLDAQIAHKHELHAIFRREYATRTTAEWLKRLEAQDLLCAPVKKLREALDDPQTHHNGMVIDVDDGGERLRVVGSPIRMTAAPAVTRRPPPRLGEHTDEVLAEARAMATVRSER